MLVGPRHGGRVTLELFGWWDACLWRAGLRRGDGRGAMVERFVRRTRRLWPAPTRFPDSKLCQRHSHHPKRR